MTSHTARQARPLTRSPKYLYCVQNDYATARAKDLRGHTLTPHELWELSDALVDALDEVVTETVDAFIQGQV